MMSCLFLLCRVALEKEVVHSLAKDRLELHLQYNE